MTIEFISCSIFTKVWDRIWLDPQSPNLKSDLLTATLKLHLSRLFCCNHTCYCVNMVSVTSASSYITPASCYHPCYQSRSSMYIRSLIPQNSAKLAEAVQIVYYGN